MSDTRTATPTLHLLPCLDSATLADARRRDLDIPRPLALSLGKSAVEAIEQGHYRTDRGTQVPWRDALVTAGAAKMSIPPDAPLPVAGRARFPQMDVQVSNETTLGAALRLIDRGRKPLALNFANGVEPGGGFLRGARAQEETLCRSSGLYHTLVGDAMYEAHRRRERMDFSAWAIYSPEVPVFRRDGGATLDEPWHLSFLTCAAPVAQEVGQPASGDLLRERIHRVLNIARSYGYEALVLGAWGCGAFKNDPHRTAADFREALEFEFAGVFSDVIFAISDWSPDRRTLGPFRDVFTVR